MGYPGLEMKIANTEDFDEELPQDGKAQGELMLRGPWVTSAYYRNPQPDKFHKVGAPGATLGSALAHGWAHGREREAFAGGAHARLRMQQCALPGAWATGC